MWQTYLPVIFYFLAWFGSDVVYASKTVSMKMHKKVHDDLQKRDLVSAELRYTEYGETYTINVTIGRPPQEIQLFVSTGLQDTWIYGPGSCNSTCMGGMFVPNTSSTFREIVPGNFSQVWGTNDFVGGDYIMDEMSLAEGVINLKGQTMAMASNSSGQIYGTLGLGLNVDGLGYVYPSILDNMVQQDFIDNRMFSVWFDGDGGNLLFGGIDSAKFEGDLVALPLYSEFDSPAINWTSLSITSWHSEGIIAITSENLPTSAALGVGWTFMYVPSDVFDVLSSAFNTSVTSLGTEAPCVFDEVDAYLYFGFGGDTGPVIPVPYSEFVYPLLYDNGSQVTNSTGTPVCMFGIFEADVWTVLGANFLRSAYVVFDYENMAVAVAPTVNTTSSHVDSVKLESVSATVPITLFTGVQSTSPTMSTITTVTILPYSVSNVITPAGAPTPTQHMSTPTIVNGSPWSVLTVSYSAVTGTPVLAMQSSTAAPRCHTNFIHDDGNILAFSCILWLFITTLF